MPRVAIGGGTALIAYDGPGAVVWSARATAGTWSAPAAVTGGSTPERLDDVTVSSTGVGHLLLAEAPAPPVLKVADDGGDPGWGVPVPLAGATPDLASDAPGRFGALAGGAVVAVWTDAQRDPDTGDVLARSVRGWIQPAGGDWSGSNFLHSVGDPATTHVSDLALATDGAEAVVAAWDLGGMVMAARATRTGGWVFEDVVLADGTVGNPAVTAGPGGALAAAWQQDGTQV